MRPCHPLLRTLREDSTLEPSDKTTIIISGSVLIAIHNRCQRHDGGGVVPKMGLCHIATVANRTVISSGLPPEEN